MGFVTPVDTTQGNWIAFSSSTIAPGASLTIPKHAKAGDGLIIQCLSPDSPGGSYSFSGMTNAVSTVDLANISGVTGGNSFVGFLVLAAADIGGAITINRSAGSTFVAMISLVRSTAVGAGSLTVQKNNTVLQTVNSTTVTGLQNAPLHANDLRCLHICTINNPLNGGITVAEVSIASNPAAAQVYQNRGILAGNSSEDLFLLSSTDVSILDTASATITETGATSAPKWYVVEFVISEGASDSVPLIGHDEYADFAEASVPIFATGADHDIGSPGADIIGRGGGGGISVY